VLRLSREKPRKLAAGAGLGDVGWASSAPRVLVGAGLALYGPLRWFEVQSRRHATLERS
jgi:hypothetical protein